LLRLNKNDTKADGGLWIVRFLPQGVLAEKRAMTLPTRASLSKTQSNHVSGPDQMRLEMGRRHQKGPVDHSVFDGKMIV
jgi:hypothetical protein